MICGCLWLVGDPAGSVGVLSRWSEQASLGTLAVASQGRPSGAGHALAKSVSGIFAATIEAPWCYLEFGAVAWCREPRLLDRSLRLVALDIANEESHRGATSDLLDSARLLREAHTNGALFLALPANGAYRNSINESGSLLRTLCQSANATECRGSGAPEAEFRTNAGTWPRVGGLLLIALGLGGMILLLGSVTLRLLLAASLSLLYLLLAPALVISPAFGETGWTVFRAWLARLLGAVAAKIAYAFLLGAVLTVTSMLDSLVGLGWWTQWLLSSAFWWGLYLRRHRLPSELLRRNGGWNGRGAPGRNAVTRSIPRRAARSLNERRKRNRERLPPQLPPAGKTIVARSAAAPVSRADALAARACETSGLSRDEKNLIHSRTSQAKDQLTSISDGLAEARQSGDRKRELRLRWRAQRVEGQLREDRERLLRNSPQTRHRPARMQAWSEFLDRQAVLPAGSLAGTRAYSELAPLVGVSSVAYERSHPGAQRQTRRDIDGALARRASSMSEPDRSRSESSAKPVEHTSPERRTPPSATEAHSSRRVRYEESPVMRDIREVEAGRKRQLGIGRP